MEVRKAHNLKGASSNLVIARFFMIKYHDLFKTFFWVVALQQENVDKLIRFFFRKIFIFD